MTTTTPLSFMDDAARVLRAAPRSTSCPPSTALTRPSVHLTVGGQLTVGPEMPLDLRHALRRHFTLPNPAYEEAERHGRSTADLPPMLLYYDAMPDGSLRVPRGATQAVYAMCEEHRLRAVWDDRTHLVAAVTFRERVTLSAAQERAVTAALVRRYGVIEAPPGAGKTVMGLAAIARRGQRALWITHTKELARQAVERAGMVLGLTPEEIGFVGDGVCRVGDWLTIGLVQSLARGIPPALRDVGMVVIDEAHRCPAEQMAGVVSQFPARFLLGLTATPTRRDGLDDVIFWHLGPITGRIAKEDLADRLIAPRIIKRPTGCIPRGDTWAAIVGDLACNEARNALIVEDIAIAVEQGRRCLVLSDRVPHVTRLTRLLAARGVNVAALHGQLPARERERVVAALNAGDVPVVVATGALIGEGFDVARLDTLFLVTPLSYAGRVRQYIGRVARTAPGKRDALVYDYADNCAMCWSSWKKRADVYRQEGLCIATHGQERAA